METNRNTLRMKKLDENINVLAIVISDNKDLDINNQKF